jgi:hypothetical protein
MHTVIRNLIRQYLEGITSPEARNINVPRPAYAPAIWNEAQMTMWANCYAYALNFRPTAENWFPEPGDRAVMPSPRTIHHLFNKAVEDGLLPVLAENAVPVEGYYLVALFESAKGENWHWYRQDAEGSWSHKDGQTHVRDTDADCRKITDPRQARWYNAEDFVSFFYVPNEGMGFGAIPTRKELAPGPFKGGLYGELGR